MKRKVKMNTLISFIGICAVFCCVVDAKTETTAHSKNSSFFKPQKNVKSSKRARGKHLLLHNSANIQKVKFPKDLSKVVFHKKWPELSNHSKNDQKKSMRCSTTQYRLVSYYNYAINWTNNKNFNFAYSQIDAYLLFVKHRIIKRHSQYLNIAMFPNIYNITFPPKFDSICIFIAMALRNLQFPMIGMLEEYYGTMSDITNGIPSNSSLHQYATARNRIRDTLSAFQSIFTRHSEDVVSKKKAFFTTCKNLLPVTVMSNFTKFCSLAETLSFSKLKLNEVFKIIISDIILLEIVRQGCKAVSSDKKVDALITTDQMWQSIHNYFEKEDEFLLTNWHKEQLRKDVEERIGTTIGQPSDGRGYNNDTMCAELEQKYYWASFRAHTYHGTTSSSAALLCGQKEGKMCIDKNNILPLVIIWWESIDSEIELKSKTPNTSATVAQPVITLATSQPHTDDFAKGAVVASNLGTFIQPITDAAESKIIQTVGKEGLAAAKTADAAAKVGKAFKMVTKALSLIGNYLGPIAGGLCAILSMFQEDGMAAVMDRLDKGFNEMHHRFDVLQAQLRSMHTDLVKDMERVADFNREFQNYQLTVQKSLMEINKTFSNFDSNYKDSASDHSNVNMVAVYELLKVCKDGEKSPFSALQSMHYYMTNKGDTNLGDVLIKYSLRNRLMLHVFLISRANELAQLIAFNARCALYRYMYMGEYIKEHGAHSLTLTSQVDSELSKIEQEMAEGFEISQDVTQTILRLDHRHLHSWQKEAVNDVKNAGFPNHVSAQDLAKTLQGTYVWNTFAVTIFAAYWDTETVAKGGSEKILQYTWLTNPDYSLVHEVNGSASAGENEPEHWKRFVIVNWALNDGQVAEVHLPTVTSSSSDGSSWEPYCSFSSNENITSFFKFRSFDHVKNDIPDTYHTDYDHKTAVDCSTNADGFPLVTHKTSVQKHNHMVVTPTRVSSFDVDVGGKHYRTYTLSTYCMANTASGF